MTNILLITADDMDGRTPGAFGGLSAATPHLDALAASGVCFTRAHVAIAVCQPSRSAIMTGILPHRNGAEGFGPIADGIGLLTEHLEGRGYRKGILGKVDHIEPVERFRWDLAKSMRDLGLGRDPAAYGTAARAFMDEAATAGAPWFLMANAHDPHRPFHGSESEREKWTEAERAAYPAPSHVFADADVVVPGFLPDLPDVRHEVAEYQSSARRCDDVVGAVLGALDASGQTDDTVVVFLSDNGMAFPFAKANCYLRSTLTPLIVRWPGITQAGRVEQRAFVNTMDLFPTFCEIAGASAPDGIDGKSLRPLLGDADREHRDHVTTVFHETSGKRRFEMRCYQDGEWGYIWNAWSDGAVAYRAENMEGRTWTAMTAAAQDDEAVRTRTEFYLRRVPEELYRMDVDPDCLDDRSGDEDTRAVRERLRAALLAALEESDDPLGSRFRDEVVHGRQRQQSSR